MSEMSFGKKFFLILCIVVPFIIYGIVYYRPILANAAYKRAEFTGLLFKYGHEGLENRYDSKTGVYRYLDKEDAVHVVNIKLTEADIDYIQKKANELGAWNFPDEMRGKEAGTLRYDVSLQYRRKTKHFFYDTGYNDIPKLGNAAAQMVKVIENTLLAAEARTDKNK